MDIMESVRVAFAGLRDNKVRSLLTMLGMIIGVGAVVAMISVGQGAQKQVTGSIQSLGSNLLIVTPGRARSPIGAVWGGAGSANTLTNEDVKAIAKIDNVAGVSPERRDGGQVKYGPNNTSTQIVGTVPEYEGVRNFRAVQGRFLTPSDIKSRKNVAVLGKTVADTLFPGGDPICKKIRIKSESFRVVGLMETKGQTGFMNTDDLIFVPTTVLERKDRPIRTVYVQVASAELMEAVRGEIEDLLRVRHKLRGREDDFTVGSQTDIIATVTNVTKTFTMLLASVAGISLLVGGIGIMNIMLVTVTERTREIGIRKAIGAKRQDIMGQFLIEALVISLTGGIIGIMLGIGLSIVVSKVGGWTTAVTLGSILLSFGVSALIGIFFGIYPARRASVLDPIVALRYE